MFPGRAPILQWGIKKGDAQSFSMQEECTTPPRRGGRGARRGYQRQGAQRGWCQGSGKGGACCRVTGGFSLSRPQRGATAPWRCARRVGSLALTRTSDHDGGAMHMHGKGERMTEEGRLSIVQRGPSWQVCYASSNPYGVDRPPWFPSDKLPASIEARRAHNSTLGPRPRRRRPGRPRTPLAW